MFVSASGATPSLTLQDFDAALMLAESFRSPPGAGIGPHQGAMAWFRKWIKRHEPARRLNGLGVLVLGKLPCGQPLQDGANQIERPLTLCREPFLARLRGDVEIGEELAPIELGCRAPLGSMRRTGQPFKAFEIDAHVSQMAFGAVGDQVSGSDRTQAFAQFGQAVAKTVPGLSR